MNITSARESVSALATTVRRLLSALNAARIEAEERHILESDAREAAMIARERRQTQQFRNYLAEADARHMADADAREAAAVRAEQERRQRFRDIVIALR